MLGIGKLVWLAEPDSSEWPAITWDHRFADRGTSDKASRLSPKRQFVLRYDGKGIIREYGFVLSK
jgi:hypothetical protein